MRFCFNDLLLAISFALDCVEHDLVGVTTNHSKRVACLCVKIGRQLQYSEKNLSDLAACAFLHDNALTEYVQAEFLHKGEHELGKEALLGVHCSYGERNIRHFPFFGEVKNTILYHHENADGSGPFHKRKEDIPDYAKLIHLADHLDSSFDLSVSSDDKFVQLRNYVKEQEGILFSEFEAELYMECLDRGYFRQLSSDNLSGLLENLLPRFSEEYEPVKLMEVAALFAKIIDYKSTFTSNHSLGIAEKAYQMGEYYGWKEEEKAEFYLAAALHDIGKLAVSTEILEKPDKLTEEEYTKIKSHAMITYAILSKIEGFEEIASWAALHHEKLNGRGYPFGYGAERLGFHERLLACLDIYQALKENRPYKAGMSHEQVMSILNRMGQNGELDQKIIKDLDTVLYSEESKKV